MESWGNVASCHLDPLFILQKKIVRIITFSNYDAPSQVIFRELNILPLYHLVQNRISFMMYKYVNGLLPDVMNELYVTNNEIHDHFTRQSHLLHTIRGNINVYTRSFRYISPRIWNLLQKKINVQVSIAKFKTSSKLFFLEQRLDINYPK